MNTNSLDTVEPEASLLIVDDSPANLQLLGGMLKQCRYKVRPVPNGEFALQSARHEPPDLILLDINMPGMNGYEVCKHLKADSDLKAIPVIFISALDGTFDKIKAFSVGGVDYVTKPFQFEEVEARVRTHLALRKKERQLQESYGKLKELEQLRDNLIHMIIHDMRSPVTVVLGTLQLLKETMPPGTENMSKFIKSSINATNNLKTLINTLLDISRLEAGQMPINKIQADLIETVRQAVDSLSWMKGELPIDMRAPVRFTAYYDQDIILRILINFLMNALKFTPANGRITIGVYQVGGNIRVDVADTGCGIPEEYLSKIFEKYAQADISHRQIGTGLGLAFCKLAIQAHGGQIGVESTVGKGSTFWFSIPSSPDR